MKKKKKQKEITFIAFDLTVLQEQPYQSLIQEVGCDKPTLFLAVCLLVIKRGNYAAALRYEDKEELCALLNLKMALLDKWLEELIDEGYFNQYLYWQEKVLTNEFIQKGFFRSSLHARRDHMTIPLECVCLSAKWRREYRLTLNPESPEELMQCMNYTEYKNVCSRFGGEEEMNKLIATKGRLFLHNDASRRAY